MDRYKRHADGIIEETGEGFVINQPNVETLVDIGNVGSYICSPPSMYDSQMSARECF